MPEIKLPKKNRWSLCPVCGEKLDRIEDFDVDGNPIRYFECGGGEVYGRDCGYTRPIKEQKRR
jgi:hypothetical protein